MADILDQFTRTAKDKEREYAAYKAVDRKQVRLKVRPAEDVFDRLPYRMLLRIMEMGRDGTKITLIYSFMAVYIEGRNLGPVADSIETEHCDFIEEFDPLRHDRPTDPKQPFIEKITLRAAAELGAPGRSPEGKAGRKETAA